MKEGNYRKQWGSRYSGNIQTMHKCFSPQFASRDTFNK